MCGIAGYVGSKNVSLSTMSEYLGHRGPDDAGIWQEDNVGFVHTRLAIQDLSPNGHQPMLSADGRYAMIFNGEIYNHREIRTRGNYDYPFKSTGDTETILAAFAVEGTSIFSRLNGIFALAILDREKKKLILARDQFGVKPLYYYQDTQQWAFSSEMKALLPVLANDKKELDHHTLANYLYYLWSPGCNTPFISVKKVPPGHFITISIENPDQYEIVRYYEIPFTGNYSNKPEKQLLDELDDLLLQAVRRQLLSDVPVGFFLSGGLDSSAVVAMAKRILPNEKLKCYTIDNGEQNDGFASDLLYARKVAGLFNCDLTEISSKPDIVQDFDRMIWHLDEPQADPAPLNVLNIARQARADGRVVLLGGTAGDDLFSGYRRHQALRYYPALHLIASLKGLIQRIGSNSPFSRRLNKIIDGANLPLPAYLAHLYSWLPKERVVALFNKNIRSALQETFHPDTFLQQSLSNIPAEKEALNWMLYWDMKYFLTDHNLNYTDKMSMAHGVEVRVPFLDIDLVEFSCRLPVDLKMKGKTTKYLLKKVMERYLPKEVIYRPKTGFGAPIRKWVQNDLSPLIEDRLSREKIENLGIFEYDALRQLIDDNKSGKIDAAYPIWALLAIDSWIHQFPLKASS